MRRACLLAALVVLAAELLAQPVFRTGVDLVSLGVTVVDRSGALVADLTAADFQVIDGGRVQPVEFFARGDATTVPLRVGLLFDTSGSMADDIRMSRTAAIRFLNSLSRAEDITLVEFDTEVRVGRYSQDQFPRLVERIRNRRPDGYTSLYDALGVYLDAAADQDGQRVLVIYTDGGDTRSALTFGEALDLVRASDVSIYAVGFLDHQSSSDRLGQRMRLAQIAEATGGQAVFPGSIKELDAAYERILAEINARYTLGYASPAHDGAWRTVEIRVTRPDLKGAKVRSRKGYYAPLRATGQP